MAIALLPEVYPLSLGDKRNSNVTVIEPDGTLRFDGDASVWVDIDFPIIVRTTGVGIPTLQTLKGNITAPQWQVNDFNVCEGQELIHGWKEGSAGQWHIHIVTNGTDATDRFLKFQIEWTYGVLGDPLANIITTTSAELKIPADTDDRVHFIFNIGNPVSLTNLHIGSHIWARLKRIAATGTAPTDDPFCSMLQMHVECDTVGSRQITTK